MTNPRTRALAWAIDVDGCLVLLDCTEFFGIEVVVFGVGLLEDGDVLAVTTDDCLGLLLEIVEGCGLEIGGTEGVSWIETVAIGGVLVSVTLGLGLTNFCLGLLSGNGNV